MFILMAKVPKLKPRWPTCLCSMTHNFSVATYNANFCIPLVFLVSYPSLITKCRSESSNIWLGRIDNHFKEYLICFNSESSLTKLLQISQQNNTLLS